MKRIISLLIVVFMLGLSSCSYSDQLKSDLKKLDSGKIASNETINFLKEEECSLPDNVYIVLDVIKDKEDNLLLLGQQSSGQGLLWKLGTDGKWTVELSLPDNFNKSAVVQASFIDQENIFCSIMIDVLTGNTDDYNTENYVFNRLDGFSEGIKVETGEISNVICSEGKIYGKNTNSQIIEYDYSKGILKTYDKSNMPVSTFTIINDCVIAIGAGKVETYNKNTGEIDKIEDSMNSFLLDKSKIEGDFTPHIYYSNSEKKLFCINHEGIYSYDMDTAEVKQLIQEASCTICKNNFSITNIRTINSTIYISCFNLENKAQLFGYDYVEEGMAVVENATNLTVYSLIRMNAVEEAVNLYNASQDKVYLHYEYGTDGVDPVARKDIAIKLNSELLANKGPDIVVLDYLNIDDVIKNEMLYDISDIVSEKDIYRNIMAPFENKNKCYAIPMFFNMIGIHANPDISRATGTFDDLTNSLVKLKKENSDKLIIDKYDQFNYVDALYLTYYNTFLHEDKIDSYSLEKFYRNLKKINDVAEYNWTIGDDKSEEQKLCDFSLIWLSGNNWTETLLTMDEVEVSISGIVGVENLVNIYSRKDKENLEFNYFKKNETPVFSPSSILAICNSSKFKPEAKEFIEYCISEEYFATGHAARQGFPVNKASLKRQLSDTYNGSTKQENSKKKTVDIKLDKLTKKIQEDFLQKAGELSEYTYADIVIKDIVLKNAQDYINGDETLEKAVSDTIKEVESYQMR